MRKNLSRGPVLAALAIALGSIVAGPMASAATTLTVGKAAPNADPIIPVNVGDQLGIFKKHGLDLKISDFTGGSKMAQAMTAGGIDIGDGAGTEMALVAKGVPMVAICETAGPIPFLGIGVPGDSPLHTIAELKGKKIGISSPGSLTDWLAKELTRKEGWGPDGVEAVAIGNGAPSVIAAFRAPSGRCRHRREFAVLRNGGKEHGPSSRPGLGLRGQCRLRRALRLDPPDRDRSRRGARFSCRLDRDRRLHPHAQGRDREDREPASPAFRRA